MKRSTLLQHLRRYGCYLKREGSAHSLWTNPSTGAVEAIPRHAEMPRKICRNLSVPEIGEEQFLSNPRLKTDSKTLASLGCTTLRSAGW